MTSSSLVELKNINKIFVLSDGKKEKDGQAVTFQALKNVNLNIKRGEFVAIVGPSGSGKSTLMNIIGLLDRPTTGEYFLDGHNVAQLKENTLAGIRNKKIGFVFQSFNLLPRTGALENVALPLIYAGLSRSARLEKARASLESLGLEDKLKSTPAQLSGGQQQRVAIARALVTEPEVILADEPTGNLDSKSGSDVMSLLRKLHKEGKTIVLITHDLDVARNAKRVIHVRDGEVK